MSVNQSKTDSLFDKITLGCKKIFEKKLEDYGAAWRVLRIVSILDQLFIKAQRIRTIQMNGGKQLVNEIGDDIPSEFKGILNYGIIGLIQLKHGISGIDYSVDAFIMDDYITFVQECKELMQKKNHDYGEAWRDMHQESFVDLIISKIVRLHQITRNKGMVQVSEKEEAIFKDIVNYSIFALILIEEGKHSA